MTLGYEDLRFHFPKENRELAERVGLTKFLKTSEGSLVVAEFHSIVRSADGSSDEAFLRGIELAVEQIQYRIIDYWTIEGLAPEQRQRYALLRGFLQQLTSGDGGKSTLSMEVATETVIYSILEELKQSRLSLH